jgi:hypothetical protein
MLTIARLFLLRWLAARTLGGVVGTTLAAALPVAALLKLVGLPLLAVVGTIGAPVALVLALLGLPLLLVLAVVGIVIAAATAAAMLALAVLKYVLPALLIGWLVAGCSERCAAAPPKRRPGTRPPPPRRCPSTRSCRPSRRRWRGRAPERPGRGTPRPLSARPR